MPDAVLGQRADAGDDGGKRRCIGEVCRDRTVVLDLLGDDRAGKAAKAEIELAADVDQRVACRVDDAAIGDGQRGRIAEAADEQVVVDVPRGAGAGHQRRCLVSGRGRYVGAAFAIHLAAIADDQGGVAVKATDPGQARRNDFRAHAVDQQLAGVDVEDTERAGLLEQTALGDRQQAVRHEDREPGLEAAARNIEATDATAIADRQDAVDLAALAGERQCAGAGLLKRARPGNDAGEGRALVVEADLEERRGIERADLDRSAAGRAVGQRADRGIHSFVELQPGALVDLEGREFRQREIVGGKDVALEDVGGAGIIVEAVEDQRAGAGLGQRARAIAVKNVAEDRQRLAIGVDGTAGLVDGEVVVDDQSVRGSLQRAAVQRHKTEAKGGIVGNRQGATVDPDVGEEIDVGVGERQRARAGLDHEAAKRRAYRSGLRRLAAADIEGHDLSGAGDEIDVVADGDAIGVAERDAGRERLNAARAEGRVAARDQRALKEGRVGLVGVDARKRKRPGAILRNQEGQAAGNLAGLLGAAHNDREDRAQRVRQYDRRYPVLAVGVGNDRLRLRRRRRCDQCDNADGQIAAQRATRGSAPVPCRPSHPVRHAARLAFQGRIDSVRSDFAQG